MKINAAMIEEVQRLLVEGALSQRKIARQVGMSRGTVNAIALGRRPKIASPPPDEYAFEYSGPLVRCPGCGGKVYLPCLLCHIRALKDRDREIRPCPHRPQLHRPARLRGPSAQMCSHASASLAAVEPSQHQTPPGGGPQFVAATPSALTPAPQPSSFTPAAQIAAGEPRAERTAT